MANTKLDKLRAELKAAQAEEKKIDNALAKAQSKVDDLLDKIYDLEFPKK